MFLLGEFVPVIGVQTLNTNSIPSGLSCHSYASNVLDHPRQGLIGKRAEFISKWVKS